jgi:hypothetical protein
VTWRLKKACRKKENMAQSGGKDVVLKPEGNLSHSMDCHPMTHNQMVIIVLEFKNYQYDRWGGSHL